MKLTAIALAASFAFGTLSLGCNDDDSMDHADARRSGSTNMHVGDALNEPGRDASHATGAGPQANPGGTIPNPNGDGVGATGVGSGGGSNNISNNVGPSATK